MNKGWHILLIATNMLSAAKVSSNVKPIARAGLIAKGLVYVLLGVLAFMAAFHLNGHSVNGADKEGVLSFIQAQTGGQLLLALIALGLFCYSIWRAVQTFSDTAHKGNSAKGIASRLRYLASGLIYASLAVYAVKMLLSKGGSSGKSSNQSMIGDLLNKPFGEFLLAAVAAIIAGIGMYQIYYGLSGKY
ncbi:MAG TPA: DUF1206 domain-containing protein, partial [Segetibacter sp.]